MITGGGVIDAGPGLEQGSWIAPTIWPGLKDDDRTVREEIFGPCVHIAPFDDEEEAIARANNTDYGLAAMLWTGREPRLWGGGEARSRDHVGE